MRDSPPIITKRERGEDGYFTVHWSRLEKAEKFAILHTVPSVAGIFELYFADANRTLNFIDTYRAWYGGLRHTLREYTDPEISKVPGLRELAERYDLVFRYSESDSSDDISDVLYFLRETKKPIGIAAFERREHAAADPSNPSGNYRYIYVNEESPDRLVTI